MTKDEWIQVEKAVQSLYSRVELQIDEYKVTLGLERLDTYRNIIMVYVNGKFNGKWLMEECEERRRFLRKREKSRIPQKSRKELSKMSKKYQKEFKEFNEKYNEKYVYYEPWWTSFSSLKRHFIKENESIKLIKII